MKKNTKCRPAAPRWSFTEPSPGLSRPSREIPQGATIPEVGYELAGSKNHRSPRLELLFRSAAPKPPFTPPEVPPEGLGAEIEGLLGGPCGPLGSLGGSLGNPWRVLGTSLGVRKGALGGSLGVLGAPWDSLGGSWATWVFIYRKRGS